MDKLDGIEKRKVMEMMKTNQTGAITLDWMYREEKPDSEEYLLGKEVDKHIEGEPVGTIEDEFDAKFGERIKANIALDMATKMREDPLFIIKQKEVEARKKIVENPIKMKRLQALIEKQKKKQEKKDKKKKKKKHKKKDDDSDSDDDLVAQYLSILSKKNRLGSSDDRKKDRKKSRDQKSEDSDSDEHYQQKSQDNRRRDRHKDHSQERGTHRGRGHDQDRHRSNRNRHRSHENRNSERDRSRENRDDTHYSERDHRTGYNEQRDRHSDSRKTEKTDSRKTNKIDRYRSSSSDTQHEKVTQKPKNRDQKRVDDSRHSRDRREEPNQKNSQKGKNSKRHKESSTSSSSDSSDEEQYVHKKSKDRERDRRSDKKNGRKDDSSPEIKRQRKHSDGDEDVRPKPYGLILSANHQPRHRSKSPRQQKQKSPEKRKKSPETKRHRSPKRKSPKRPLTEEERERKLAEMMDNAKWRNEQRKKNVSRYKDEDKREQDEIINDHKTSFVNDMMSEHASKSSLEDRLNRNKHNIQRTRHALDKNFLKK